MIPMRIMNLIKLLVAAAVLASAGSAAARSSDYSQPVNVVSAEQLADLKTNTIIFAGDVVATQGSMEIKADKIEVKRGSDGKLDSVTAYGKPVTFRQILDNGKPIHTRSARLSYLPRRSLVVLSGKATIWQDESSMSGERIEYNIQTQKMKANNATSQGGRVSSTFVPAELNNAGAAHEK